MSADTKAKLTILVIILITCLIILGNCGIRFDFESGSHRITPTAVDVDFWGNYKVWFKTNEYTKNSEEDFYYIAKDNSELADQIKDCIKNGETIMVYYDKYVGWKGVSSPKSSPIVKIEVVE